MFRVVIVLSLLICAYGDENIFQYRGINPIDSSGFASNNYTNIASSKSYTPNLEVVCYDDEYQVLWTIGRSDSFTNLFGMNSLGEQLFSLPITNTVGVKVVCDIYNHTLIYLREDNTTVTKTFYGNNSSESMNLLSLNYPTLEHSYWSTNADSTIFYVTSDDYYIQSYSSITGEFIAKSANTISQSYINLFNIQGGLVSLMNGNPVVLDENSLEELCTILLTDVFSMFTDGVYIFILSGNEYSSYNINSYDSFCIFRWRVPRSVLPGLFSYDTFGNILFNNYMKDGIVRIDSHGNQAELVPTTCISNSKENCELYGIDNAANIYFYSVHSDNKYYLYRYSSDFSGKIDNTIVVETYNNNNDDFIPEMIALTSNGTIFQPSDNTVIALTVDYDINDSDGTNDNSNNNNVLPTLENYIAFGIVLISLISAILIFCKHLCFGEDPKGWNQRKIPEIIVFVVLTLSLIILALISGVNQFSTTDTIEENIEDFKISSTEFYETYLSPCYSESSIGSPVEYCTCSGGYTQENSCISGACDSSTADDCTALYHDTCDCRESYFKYSCDCEYGEFNTCNVTLSSSQTPADEIQSSWANCQSQYTKPTRFLWATFSLTMLFSILIIILNVIQALLKFDTDILDVVLSIVSISSSIIILILIIVGNSYVTQKSCIDPVLQYATGCILNAEGNQLVSQEQTAQESLKIAYSNLSTTPILFLICAIPDVLAIVFCIFGRNNATMQLYPGATINGYEDVDQKRHCNWAVFKDKETAKKCSIPLLCFFVFAICIVAIGVKLFFIVISNRLD